MILSMNRTRPATYLDRVVRAAASISRGAGARLGWTLLNTFFYQVGLCRTNNLLICVFIATMMPMVAITASESNSGKTLLR